MINRHRTLQVVESPSNGEAVLDDDRPPLVSDGKYQLAFLYYETKVLHGRANKLVLWFQIVDPGPYHGKKIARYYNVQKLIGRQGRNGAFKAGWRSDFVREYAALFGIPPQRADRIPMSRFENVLIEGQVHRVTRSSRGRPIPEDVQYTEPRRDSRRLQTLRGWSHEQSNKIFARSSGTRGSNGI